LSQYCVIDGWGGVKTSAVSNSTGVSGMRRHGGGSQIRWREVVGRPAHVRDRPPHHSLDLDVVLEAEVVATSILGGGLLRLSLTSIGSLGLITT
jgi:hypothetical protein